MSRAPAPMSRPDTTSAVGSDPNNTNPYGHATYSMMPPTPQSSDHSPINSMQKMYTQSVLDRQRQYQLQQQMQSGQQFGPNNNNTMQNVSVVDFKPNIMAQHEMDMMRQNYQNQMSMTAAEPPSLGLVGPDGTWNAATAADPYSSNDTMHNNHHITGAPLQRRDSQYNARNRMRSSLPSRNSVSSDMYTRKPSSGYLPGRCSSEYMSHDEPSRNTEYKYGRYPPMHVGDHASYNNENSARMNQRHPDAQTISQIIDARVDARTQYNAVLEARNEARVEARVQAGLRQERSMSATMGTVSTPTPMPEEPSSPPSDPIEDHQRQLVGAAVKQVMLKYNVTPRVSGNLR